MCSCLTHIHPHIYISTPLIVSHSLRSHVNYSLQKKKLPCDSYPIKKQKKFNLTCDITHSALLLYLANFVWKQNIRKEIYTGTAMPLDFSLPHFIPDSPHKFLNHHHAPYHAHSRVSSPNNIAVLRIAYPNNTIQEVCI